jgi:Restriction endonuclease XhoI
MHDIEDLIRDLFIDAGFPAYSVHKNKGSNLELPGHYRPSKNWDIVVVHNGLLVAAIECKSQTGKPGEMGEIGKNFNNRIEEAIGSAKDLLRAYEKGRVGRIRPWMGYFFILEDSEDSRHEVGQSADTLIKRDDAFRGSSYIERYRLFLMRLIEDKVYDAACFLTAAATQDAVVVEPDPMLSFEIFAKKIADRAQEVQSIPSQPSDEGALF